MNSFHHVHKKFWAILLAFLLCFSNLTAVISAEGAAGEQTIFTDQVPEAFGDPAFGQHLNLGVRFQVLRPGRLLGCRIYAGEEESDVHEIRLWDAEAGELLLGPLEWSLEAGDPGWRTYRFPEALPIEAERDYILCVSNSETYPSYPSGSFSHPVCQGDLVTFADSGVLGKDFTVMPDESAGNVHYFRDVIFSPDVPALDHIAVTSPPAQMEYFVGDHFSPEGMEVTAFFVDGSAQVLPPQAYTYAPGGPLTAADTFVAITYESQTVNVRLTVLPVTLSDIFLSKFPEKTAYLAGEAFDPAGMEVTARYNNGSLRPVTDYTCAPAGPLSPSDTEITVTYEGQSVTCPIQVSPAASTAGPPPGPEAEADIEDGVLTLSLSEAARLSADALEAAERQGAALRLCGDGASVLLPAAAVTALRRAGGTLSFTMTRPDAQTVSFTISADGAVISEIPGGVLLELPRPDAAPDTVVRQILPEGASRVVRGACAVGGRLLVPLPGPGTVAVGRNAKAFRDVPASEAVDFVASRELFCGAGGDTFAPEAAMTRGMLVQVLHNLEGNPRAGTSGFEDVPGNAWYAGAVDWAAARGIVRGDGVCFRGDEPITRRDFTVILWRYAAGAAEGDAQTWAAAAGLTACAGNPQSPLTRLEAAGILQQFMQLGLHIQGLPAK